MAASAAISLLDAGARLWADGMSRACGQGGLFVLAVLLLCRLAPRLPASARYALWWLACLKLLIGLFCAAAIALPVLPRMRVSVPAAPRFLAPTAPTERSGGVQANAAAPIPSGAPGKEMSAAAPAATETARRRSVPAVLAAPDLPSPAGVLFLVWLAGTLCVLARGLRSLLDLRYLLRRAGPVASDLVAETQRLSAAMGLRVPVRLLESAAATAPFVAGPVRPVVVLPAGFADTLSPDEARMALAHELAHLRRGDLWHGLLPALAHTLFWFFPPVWLACRECAAAREEASDDAALRATGATAARYGHLLLKMAAGGDRHLRGALGISSGFFALRRRLRTIQRFSFAPSSRLRRVVAGLLVLSLLGALPWRITAGGRAVAAPVPPAPPRVSYTITDLGTLGGNYSHAYALNESGQVVGCANLDPRDQRVSASRDTSAQVSASRDTSAQGHAFLWDNGRMRDLGVLWHTTPRSLAAGINDQGQVVATSFVSTKFPHAFLWNPDPLRGGIRKYLRGLPGFLFYKPAGINARGQIVGHAQTGASDWGALKARAFLWEAGRMRDLGTLGGKYGHAAAINADGQVAGKADLAPDADGTRTHAFLWHDGRMRDLGTLPGGRNSLAAALSNRGVVVGCSETDETRRAFLWQDGQMRDLGTLPGDLWSEAQGVNDGGRVVGVSYSSPEDATGRAVLWENGAAVDLNERLPADSGWTLESARAINGKNQIIGQGWIRGQRHAFLLTPVNP